ncbi:MAG: type restriction protein res subunit [Sedimentibacter sp.]|jgi:superfamily II DNA or RNA helicase|nr:type restriction protein res subunit [Sedimentibacter sp.]
MIEVIIDSRIRLNWKELPKEMFKELKESLTYKNPLYQKGLMMGYGTKGVPQTITSYDIEKEIMTISRGASYKLKEIARNNDIEIKFIDNRISLPYEFNSDIELRDYQKKPSNQLFHFENGLVQGPCGCGKTIILLKTIERIGQKTLIIVHEQKLQQQWFDEIHTLFKIPKEEIGLIGGISKGKNKVKPITVALQQSLLRSAGKYKDEFGCIVCDEVHRYAASTFQEVVDVFPAKFRIGATATPKRKDGKHFLVFDQFGKILHEITEETLKENNMTMDIKVVVVFTEFEYTGIMERHKNRIFKGNDSNGKAIWEEQEIEYVNNNEYLEQIILDQNRNRLIYRFLKEEVENKQYCILLSDRRRFCHNWQRWLEQKGIESKLLVGGSEYKEEGDNAIKRIEKDGDLYVVIGTTVADEGLNIKKLSRGFTSTPTATNERRIIQQTGRIKRICEGKKDAIWYYFLDHKVKGSEKQLKMLKKLFKNIEILETPEDIDEYFHIMKEIKG